MAIKPFEIQSPGLVLAGVQMQAGTTGVVIPGVTQATSYSVDEVDDTGDQTTTWGSVPTVIDNGRYEILNGGPAPSGYVESVYTVEELDGDSYITEVQVDTAGSFPSSYQTTVEQNMWATEVADPFTSFNPSDWTRIPFAPQTRAGEIENIGGGGITSGFDYVAGDPESSGEFSANDPDPVNASAFAINPVTQQNINIDDLITYYNDKKIVTTIVDNSGNQASYDIRDITTITQAYNGFKAVFTKQWGNDPGFSKIAIYRDSADVTAITQTDTNNDEFTILINSGQSDVLALIVLYTENTSFTPSKANLFDYFTNFVDNILIPNGNNISDIRRDFYNQLEVSTGIMDSWNESPFNLQFYTNNVNSAYYSVNPSSTSGSGVGFIFNTVIIAGDGSYRAYGSLNGTGYAVNDTITFDGTLFNGLSGDNDLTVSVLNVDVDGAVTGYIYTGNNPGVWPVDNIDDGGDDQYDGGNYLQTNQQPVVPYSDGTVQNTGAFNTNEWFVGYGLGQFVFVGNNDGFPVDNFGTFGDTGADGGGQRVSGNLSESLLHVLNVDSLLDYNDIDFSSGTFHINFDIAGPDTNGVVFSQTQTNTITTNSSDLVLSAADDIDIRPNDMVRLYGGTKAVGQNNSGGGVIINAGAGSDARQLTNTNAGDGGYVEISAGSAGTDDGNTSLGSYGGYVNIYGGGASGNNNGGDVTIGGGAGGAGGHRGNVVINQSSYSWVFDYTGNTVFPVLNTERGDTASGTLTGPTMRMGTPNHQQLVITTPDGDTTVSSSQRFVINPGKGADGTSGEGGDIYLWAGRGGSGDTGNAVPAGTGGDIKIRGGYGPLDADGGYIRIEGGETAGLGPGGFIEAYGGASSAGNGGDLKFGGGYGGGGASTGGNANIQGGYGVNYGGNINITGGVSGSDLSKYGNINLSSGPATWKFDNFGNLTLPTDSWTVNYANGTQVPIGGSAAIGNVTFDNVTVQGTTQLNLSAGPDYTANLAYLQLRAGDVASHIHLDTGNNNAYDLIIGNDQKYVQVSSTGNIIMSSYDGTNSYPMTLDTTGNLALPGNILSVENISVLNASNYSVGGTNEGGIPGTQGSQTFTASLLSNPGIDQVRVGWTVTGNNLTSGTVVTNVAELSPGFYEFTTNTPKTDPFWYNDAYNFAPPSTTGYTFGADGKFTVPGIIQTVGTGFDLAFTSTITDISTGGTTVTVTLADSVFGDPFRGQVSIAGVTGTTQANGIWYYEAVMDNQFVLYADSTYNLLVDGTNWTTYVSGGIATAPTQGQLTLSGSFVNVTTNNTNLQWTFDDGAALRLPGGTSALYSETDFTGWWSDNNTGTPNNGIEIDTNVQMDVFSNGNVIISTGVGNVAEYNWTFDTAGNLTVPGNVLSFGSGRFTGSFLEADATQAGMFMGYAGGTPRIMFATGTTGQTFEIDNDGGNLRFYQPGSTKATLTSSGDFSTTGAITATGKIGYAAGGSVTQTGTGQGVTLNQLTGAITLAKSSWVANDVEAFVVQCNKVAADDYILAQISGTYSTYFNVAAYYFTGTSFFINLRALDTINSTPIVKFFIMKAPTA